MLTNYVSIVPINTKTSENITNAYLKHIYPTLGGSKYILSDMGGEFSSKQFTWLAKELGFTEIYISTYTPTGKSVTERTHSFLKASL